VATNINAYPKSINLLLPYLSTRYATKGIAPREVIPKEPIIKPIFASFPPKSFIYIGRRKNEEKLQKKKKLAAVARVKFLNCGEEKRDAIFFCRNQLNSA